MRKKQLFALLMASALTVGMAPTAAFAAADTAVESAEEEVSGEIDASDTEAPAEDPADTPAEDPTTPEEPAEDPAEDPTETPAEDPAADPTEAPAAEETDAQAAEAEGTAIVVGETSYPSLAEAFAAVPDTTDLTGRPTYVKVKGEIELSATVDVPATKNIMLVAAEDTTIKRAAGFTGSMFTVNGGNLQMAGGSMTDTDGTTVIGNGTLTVDGTGDGVTGSIVEVISGNYALTDDATLTGNKTTGNGGAISNAAGANVYLLGGTITGNAAATGGGIYSEGTVNLKGTVSVTGNTVTDAFSETASNVVLDKDGVINVTGAVTDSTIGVAVQEAAAGRTVVKLADSVTEDVKLADVLTQITYEGESSLKIGEDGTLVSATDPTPSPAETKLVVTGKSMKWTGHDSVQLKFQSNVKGTYYIDWVKRGEKAPTIDTSKVGAPIEADTTVTAKVTDLPDYDVDIYVCVISDKDKSNYGHLMFQPIAAERPAAPATPTPTPSHTAVVPDVNESVVQGFENALVFYPNTFYDFTVIGAGTQNTNPGEGDVRWVPVGWSMSSNPTSWNTSWKIGAAKGIYTETEKAYTIYIKYNKQVYSGTNWEETDASEILSYQFKAAPLTQATVTPADGTSGDGTSGDGTTTDGTTDVTPTTYADGTNGTSKSAVATGDESPIGTMMALAAASVLAGGYVLVRRRKKEM